MQSSTQGMQAKTEKLLVIFLLLISFVVGGVIAINLHDLIHIKCAAAGECFGAGDIINNLSLLPFWIILANTLSMALLLSSSLLLIIFCAKATRDKIPNQGDSPTSAKLKPALLKLFLISLALSLLCSGIAFWFTSQ